MKRNSAFSLVELLIIVAVIAIIVVSVASMSSKPVNLAPSRSGTVANTVYALEVIPEPTDYVVDTIGALSPETKATIRQKCVDLESKNSAELAVLVVNTTAPLSLEGYSIKVAEKWKVGKKGKDNGIILLWAKGDRKVRIETGRGTEAVMPDFMAGRIVDQVIIPLFKQGRFDEGMTAGVDAIVKEVSK